MNKFFEQCPVCGMPTGDEVPSVQYHKTSFQFCTLQCQETFKLNPKLYSSGFRENRIEIIKKRKLHLEQACDTAEKNQVESFLIAVMGVREVSLGKLTLVIDYDLMQTSLSQIIKLLADTPVKFSHTWWHKMKRSWILYKEKNEIDNIKRGSGSCCNRPPSRS